MPHVPDLDVVTTPAGPFSGALAEATLSATFATRASAALTTRIGGTSVLVARKEWPCHQMRVPELDARP